MRNSVIKTPRHLMSRRAVIDAEGSEASECTPKGIIGRGGHLFRQAQTCVKPRPLQLPPEPFTTFKRRVSPLAGDSVKVYVRVKPVMEDDLKQGRTKEALYVCEKDGKRGIAIPTSHGRENWFADFDGVLDDATNQQVFDAIGGGLVDQYLEGTNVSIMAYGQTGSGKTYSMFGCNEPGAVQVQGLLHLVLNRVDELVCIGTYHVRLHLSVFELYNDEVYSLLDASGAERRLLIKDLYKVHKPKQINNVETAISLILEALQNRTKDSTARNATSSRSHAFVKLRLEQSPTSPDEQEIASTLFLVDLAGSESILHANSSVQQKETLFINSSLNALERVVNSMSTGSHHVPYRDSLLTKVLREGFSPHNARVTMVTTVNRFQSDATVTKGTLMFAQRARNVRTFAQVNPAPKRPVQTCPEEIACQLQHMQAINYKLRQQLADLESSHERHTRERHVDAMREELHRLSEVHVELQRTSSRQQQEAETALELERAAHSTTRAQLSELQHCNEDLQTALTAAGDEVRAASRTATELRSQVTEAQLESARLNGELAGARALNGQVQAQHMAAQEQLVQAKEQLTWLKGQLAVAEAGDVEQQRELERQLAQLRTEANAASSTATADASTLQQRVRDLQQRLDDADQSAARQSQDLADALEQIVQLRRCTKETEQDFLHEVDTVRRQLQGAEQRLSLEADRVRALEGDLAAARDQGCHEVGRLTSALREAEDAVQELRRQVPPPQAEMVPDGGAGDITVEDREVAHEELMATQQQLAERTGQLELMEEQLVAFNEQLAAAHAQTGAVKERLGTVRGAAETEIAFLREQLVQQTTAADRQAATHTAGLAAAVQEARNAAEAAAAERLVPLQTECERLRATGALSEQQLARMQVECDRLRADSSSAVEQVTRLQAECDRVRETARRAEAEAAGRLAKLEALVERDVAPRPDTLKQLQDRVRLLENEKKRDEANQRGQLELKDKLIHQLELMNNQLQVEVTKLRQDTAIAQMSDQQACTSPYTGPQHSSRSDAVSPGPADEGTPVSSAAPSRAPSGGGLLLLGRTTTGSAAALARNTKARSEMSTPPPVPRTFAGPSATSPVVNMLTPQPEPAPQEFMNLITPASTPGPPEAQLTPLSCPPLDDGLVIVVRGPQRSHEMKSFTSAIRNQINY